jgi:hypothetical protein
VTVTNNVAADFAFQIRGGTGIIFDNTINRIGNGGYNKVLALNFFRGSVGGGGVCTQDRFYSTADGTPHSGGSTDYLGTQQPGSGYSGFTGQDPNFPSETWGTVPVYFWNTHVNAPLTFGQVVAGLDSHAAKFIQANRDWFGNNSSWTPGTTVATGVASGTTAQMNAVSGTANPNGAAYPGVGFWATDTNTLYVWKNAAWTSYYTEYTYPHPLTSILPVTAVSRKVHGSAGLFDIALPLTGTAGIECRSGGVNNAHQLIVTFPRAITFTNVSVTTGTGTVASTSMTPDNTQVTINLTSVSNAQTILVTLSGVNDGTTTNDVVIGMGVLMGDTTGNGSVNSSDISQTQSQSGQPVTSGNFREDVTVDGLINSSDISVVQSQSGTGL